MYSLTHSESDTDHRISQDLVKLIRIVIRTFYDFELFLFMDMLIIHSCLKEQDLADLLHMDIKMVHQHLLNLKSQKFVKENYILENDGNKSLRHRYFYINYKMMVKTKILKPSMLN